MLKVVVFIAHYFPARHFGGPTRSTATLVECIDNVDFYIFTSDTDYRDDKRLEGVESDVWQERGSAKVFYASKKMRSLRAIRRVVSEIDPDIIYLHSFFAIRFTQAIVWQRRLGLMREFPLIVAPRGEFSPEALGLKKTKKQAYRVLAKLCGLYQGVTWHACSQHEATHIKAIMGDDVDMIQAPNLPPPPIKAALERHADKISGRARLAFISRISPMKNLLGALEILSQVRAPVVYDIYGPKEDLDYWSQCEKKIMALPPNIVVNYCGQVDPEGGAEQTFSGYDALFLPTLGENYGYVIPEAWAAATPVLISDRTPWVNLEYSRSGWDFPLSEQAEITNCIERLAAMDEGEHSEWRFGAYSASIALGRDDALRRAYEQLFDIALGKKVIG